MQLFVSYAHKDNEIILPVVEELDKHYNCWIDKDISYGSSWRNEITKAISKSKVILYFVSSNSIVSTECKEEIKLAFKLNKKIIPIIIDNCNLSNTEDEIIKQLTELQWIYLEDIYKLFNVLKSNPLTVIELNIIFNSLILLVLLYLSLR